MHRLDLLVAILHSKDSEHKTMPALGNEGPAMIDNTRAKREMKGKAHQITLQARIAEDEWR